MSNIHKTFRNKTGTTVFFGMRLLPKAKREALYTLIAWARHLEEVVESPLSDEEKMSVREVVLEQNAGRLPILLGCGGNNTCKLVDKLSKDPMEGVDALLSVVPYYNKPTQAGMYAHFKAIAEATDLLILYNVPGRTGVNMLPDTVFRLASDFKNIVGIKEASGNVEQIETVLRRRPEGFKVFSGDDGITLPLIKSGADGVISVIGNAYAAEFAELVHLAQSGDYAAAEVIDHRFTELYRLLFVDGNPAGIKCLMELRGMLRDELRLPLVPASQATRELLKAQL